MKKTILLLVTILGLSACIAPLPDRPALPQVQLPVANDATALWNPADYDGKPILIVFMGSWCPWCKKTMPAVMQIAQEYGDRAEIVAVFMDEESAPVEEAIEKNGFTVKALFDGQELAQTLGVNGLPHSLVFNKHHRLAHQWEGFSPDRLKDYRLALAQLTD